QISSLKSNYGITSGELPKRGGNRLLTPEQHEFLLSNLEGTGNKQMADMLNDEFGLSLTAQQINSYKSNRGLTSGLTGWFNKGQEPWNKGKKGWVAPGSERTQFKKGQIPANYRPVGSERICKREGYVLIK